jgi:hypothetical protein
MHMRWRIDGADRETGEDRSILVQAENRGSAERAASKMGMLIAAVRAEEPHRLPPLEELASEDGENEALACLAEEWVGQGLPPPRPVALDDRGLRIIAGVLRIGAVLGYVAGAGAGGMDNLQLGQCTGSGCPASPVGAGDAGGNASCARRFFMPSPRSRELSSG